MRHYYTQCCIRDLVYSYKYSNDRNCEQNCERLLEIKEESE